MDHTTEYKYLAFISYKREDEEWAKWLQHKLEHYRLPTSVRKLNPALPERVRPIFKDTTDLAGGVLVKAIEEALKLSRYLIVICSPRSAQSVWVCKEVQEFIDSGREQYIIPFIVEGEPNSLNIATECYPKNLRDLSGERELLGININEMGRDAAAIKVVARILCINFDTLWQRWKREKKNRRRIVVTSSILGVIISLTITCILLRQSRMLQINQARAIAYRAQEIVEDGDSYLAQRLLLEVISTGHKRLKKNIPELETSLRKAYEHNTHIFRGHEYGVTCCDISNDGKYLLSGAYDNTIRLWSLKNGKCLKAFKYPSEEFKSIAFSPSCKYFAFTSSCDNKIVIWDITNNEDVNMLVGHTAPVLSVKYSRDGKYLISSSEDKTIRLWDAENGECLKVFKGHDHYVSNAIFNHTEDMILSTSFDRTLKLWDLETGKCVRTLKGHKFGIHSADFSPDDKLIVSASADKSIKLWRTETGQCIRTIDAHTDQVLSAQFSPNGEYIVSGSYDNDIKIWDINNGDCVRKLNGHTNHVNCVKYSPDGKHLVSASHDKTLRLWEAEIQLNTVLTDHRELVSSTTYSPDGNLFATASLDRTIKIWDTKTRECIKTFTGHTININCVAFSHDGKTLASACADGTVRLWNVETGEYKELHGHTDWVNSVSFSPDGKLIASASSDLTTRIWQVETGQCIKILKDCEDDEDYVSCAVFSPNGKYIATGSGMIRIWTLDSNTPIKIFRKHCGVISCISFSPDGTLLASASDMDVRIWDVEKELCLNTFEGHTSFVTHVDFSPGGHYVVSGSMDKDIRIWSVRSSRNECIGRLTGHTDWVNSVSFSPDTKTIISGSSDNTIRLWYFYSFEKIINDVRIKFKDSPLTKEERIMYYLEN